MGESCALRLPPYHRTHRNKRRERFGKRGKPAVTSCKRKSKSLSVATSFNRRGNAPLLEALQHQVEAWNRRNKFLFYLLILKTHLVYFPRKENPPDIKLIKTDTTLRLKQKAEKRCWAPRPRRHRRAASHIALTLTSMGPDQSAGKVRATPSRDGQSHRGPTDCHFKAAGNDKPGTETRGAQPAFSASARCPQPCPTSCYQTPADYPAVSL
ncbi:uncharacterized protein LOC117795703 [Ailuropoda melanoleuca]|uniref:uncharacterized protein LOC117795703 n=1 Tax=Ailuropoda melanoleuca TaxID=9646 RepID=UPI001493F412|nr:uncharacterized protein LOC117795703 [Ailuropoda melanoleuca]